MPRFSEVDPDSSEELKAVAEHVFSTRKRNIVMGRIPSMFGMLFHRPQVAQAFSTLGNELRHKGLLSDRIRDLTILQVARLNRCAYLWHVHLDHALASGLDRDSLYRLDAPDPAHFGARDRAVLAYARAMTIDIAVPDAIFAEARRHFSEPELVELTAVIGFYNMNTRMLVAFGIDNEEGRPTVALPFGTGHK